MRPLVTKIIVLAGVLTLGFALGWFSHVLPERQAIENVRESSSDYKFINPLLFVKVPEDQAFPEYVSLRDNVSNYVDQAINEDQATDVSVYFRNLNTSQWVHINPDEVFSPASMLKVVVLISTLRAAESDPKLLTKRVTLAGGDPRFTELQLPYHPPKNPVKIGGTYTINELLNHLIAESDNIASAALVKEIGEDKIFKTYDDLQLHRPSVNGPGYTTREYSHLYRALYNGTYLSRSVSEQVLELLSNTDYSEGLVAPLPPGIVVAHKFGVNASLKEGAKTPEDIERQLHDCGIIYYPKKPYFLCVMTRGEEYSNLESVIQNISRITWENVSKLRK